MVDGLFGSPYDRERLMAMYAERPLQLQQEARSTDGMYFWQGLVRTTRRIVHAADTKRYLDLHPGEEVLVGMLDGKHTLADIERASDEMRAVEYRMPMRSGVDLLVQLDNIGVLAVGG